MLAPSNLFDASPLVFSSCVYAADGSVRYTACGAVFGLLMQVIVDESCCIIWVLVRMWVDTFKLAVGLRCGQVLGC